MNDLLQDIDVPAAVKERALRELMPGERILWAGKPGRTRLCLADVFCPLLLPFSLAAWGIALNPPQEYRLLYIIGAALSGLFLLKWGCFPFWLRYGRARMLCMVTNRRAFRLYPNFFGGLKAESYGLLRLRLTRLIPHRDGSGDLIFGYRRMVLGGRYARNITYIPWGFKNIPDAARVYELLMSEVECAAERTPMELPAPEQAPAHDLTPEQAEVLRNCMESGEKLCWAERARRCPEGRRVRRAAVNTLLTLCGLFFVFYLFFNGGISGGMAVFCGIILFACGHGLLLAAKDFLYLLHTPQRYYALTTRRALVLHPTCGIEDAFPLHPYLMQEHRMAADGSGSLVLGYDPEDAFNIKSPAPRGFLSCVHLRAAEAALTRAN